MHGNNTRLRTLRVHLVGGKSERKIRRTNSFVHFRCVFWSPNSLSVLRLKFKQNPDKKKYKLQWECQTHIKILTNQPIQKKARWENLGNKWKKERDLTLRGTFFWFTVAAGKERVLELSCTLSLSLSACLIFLFILFWCFSQSFGATTKQNLTKRKYCS